MVPCLQRCKHMHVLPHNNVHKCIRTQPKENIIFHNHQSISSCRPLLKNLLMIATNRLHHFLMQLSSCAVESAFSQLNLIRNSVRDNMLEDMTHIRTLERFNGDLTTLFDASMLLQSCIEQCSRLEMMLCLLHKVNRSW